MSKKILPEDVDFEIEKEVWNLYELQEGKHRVTIRMRTILTKLLKPRFTELEPPLVGVPRDLTQPPKGVRQEEFQMSFHNVLAVATCPAELMGKPSPPIPPNELSQLPTEEISFTAFNEEWNVYKISESGLKLRVKLVVSSISKAKGAYDPLGYPIYLVQSTNAVVPVVPKTKK